jgi:hypothetical protein
MLYVLFICHENLVLRTCRDHLDILHVIGIMSIDGFWHHRKTQIDSTAPAVELVSLAKKRWIYFSIHSKDTIAHRNDIFLLTVILALRQNDI